jgi:DtxR family Mn-dependent transcriptional regulator
MTPDPSKTGLTGSLEDYLETIYLLVRDRRIARVRDIARARGVKAGSVSPALKRLSELGLVDYEQREYVDLTPLGEQAARRVFARHQLLTRFFVEVLQMPGEAADAEACKLEHSLSDGGMDRLVRFFEFLAVCPHRPAMLEAFRGCRVVHSDSSQCSEHCELYRTTPAAARSSAGLGRGVPAARGSSAGSAGRTATAKRRAAIPPAPSKSLSELVPGRSGRVTQVNAQGSIRQRLLDMGILPSVEIEVQRVGPSGSPVWIRLEGSQLALRKAEADAVLVTEE